MDDSRSKPRQGGQHSLLQSLSCTAPPPPKVHRVVLGGDCRPLEPMGRTEPWCVQHDFPHSLVGHCADTGEGVGCIDHNERSRPATRRGIISVWCLQYLDLEAAELMLVDQPTTLLSVCWDAVVSLVSLGLGSRCCGEYIAPSRMMVSWASTAAAITCLARTAPETDP